MGIFNKSKSIEIIECKTDKKLIVSKRLACMSIGKDGKVVLNDEGLQVIHVYVDSKQVKRLKKVACEGNGSLFLHCVHGNGFLLGVDV